MLSPIGRDPDDADYLVSRAYSVCNRSIIIREGLVTLANVTRLSVLCYDAVRPHECYKYGGILPPFCSIYPIQQSTILYL